MKINRITILVCSIWSFVYGQENEIEISEQIDQVKVTSDGHLVIDDVFPVLHNDKDVGVAVVSMVSGEGEVLYFSGVTQENAERFFTQSGFAGDQIRLIFFHKKNGGVQLTAFPILDGNRIHVRTSQLINESRWRVYIEFTIKQFVDQIKGNDVTCKIFIKEEPEGSDRGHR